MKCVSDIKLSLQAAIGMNVLRKNNLLGELTFNQGCEGNIKILIVEVTIEDRWLRLAFCREKGSLLKPQGKSCGVVSDSWVS